MKQKDLQDSAKRAALGKLSGLVGIVCNVGLAGSKLAVGKLAVLGIAEPFDQHIYHIKAFAEYLMAECKPGCDFSHDFHLIVFNNLICHDCSSPSSFLYFV